MPTLLDALAELCREHPLREKVVVVPSLAIGHQIGDAVARGGTSWINLRFETVRTIADAVAGLTIARDGLTVLSRAQALAIVERVCDRVLGSDSYFAALADRPGLHRALQRSLDDLRHAGVQPDALQGSGFEDPRKARDLARILEAYEDELRRGRYVDRFGVLQRATAMAPQQTSDAIWVLLADLELTTAEEALVRAVAGEHRILATDKSVAAPAQFRKAFGEENEIRGALRAIVDGRVPADSAEVIYTARDPYLPLAFELLAEYGIPATFAEGIPAHFTRPGQACLAFLRWMGEGWHAAELQRIATGRMARVIRNAGTGWGRDRYLPSLDAMIGASTVALEKEEDETRRQRMERSIADANEASAFVADLLSMTEGVANEIDVATAAAAAQAFARTTRVRNDPDVMAREGLARMFGELASIAGSAASSPARAEITGRLADAVRNLHVSASNPRPGHLHVAPVRAGGWSGRPRLFVIGLDEERHPGRGLQDPVLLDLERESIGVPIVGDRPQRVLAQFQALLGRAYWSAAVAPPSRREGRAGGTPADQPAGTPALHEVTLSWASLRITDRREQFPSAALLDAYRTSTANTAATYDALIASAIEERFVDPTALSASDWWLYRRFVDGDPALREAVLASHPLLASGAHAEAQRASTAITPWDGRITAAAEELDPRRNGRTYSASQLERLAGCPFRHFLERILHVRPLDELKFDPDIWLDALQYGSLIHTVFERTMKELCAADRKPSLVFLDSMERIATEELASWRRRVPPSSETAFQRRERELLRSCEVFLRTEETRCAEVTPSHFEYRFQDFDLPLGQGRTIRLQGFIDRIDRVDGPVDDRVDVNTEWHVWDYKSGLVIDYDGQWRLQCGTKMQHAIYARAVEATLGGRVTKSGYSFPTPRGRGARIERECTDAELQRAVNLLSDVVGSGWFPHAEESQCRWCDFKTLCGGARLAGERTQAKLDANPDDPAVQAWLALQGME